MTKAPFRLALAPLAIAAALVTPPAHAGGVKAGTLIENTASATYDGGAGPVTIPSNTITVKVDELLDVTVTSRDSGPVSAAPGSAGPRLIRLPPTPPWRATTSTPRSMA